MVYEKTIKIAKKEAERLEYLLDQEELDFEAEGVEEDATLLPLTANFENGYSMEINVCTGQQNCYVDSILYSNQQDNLSPRCYVAEPEFGLLGEFYFELNRDKYIVNVVAE